MGPVHVGAGAVVSASVASWRPQKTDIKGPWYSVTIMVMFPVADEGGDKVMRHLPPVVRGADVSKWRRPRDHKGCGGALLGLLLELPCFWTSSVGINHATQCFHVPSVSSMACSRPSPQGAEEALSNMDEPSAPTQNTAACVGKITPRKM
jgi:hypothetical protein